MLPWLTVLLLVGCATLAATAGFYLVRRRLLDDWLLLAAAVLELGLLVQLVVGLARGATRAGAFERPVFIAYLVTLPFVPPAACFLALKEKTRWAMGIVLGSAFVVAVLVWRLNQLWSVRG